MFVVVLRGKSFKSSFSSFQNYISLPLCFHNSSTSPLRTIVLFMLVRVIILGLCRFNHFLVKGFLLLLTICRLFVRWMCLYCVQLCHMRYVLLSCLCRSWSIQISIPISSVQVVRVLCRSLLSLSFLFIFKCLIVCLSPCRCVAVYLCFSLNFWSLQVCVSLCLESRCGSRS